MAIKIDLEKAFDRLRWDFIQDTLYDVGLPENLIYDLILYDRADIANVDVINSVLTCFGHYSGHKVNRRKTTIYFWLDTSQLLKDISDHLGFCQDVIDLASLFDDNTVRHIVGISPPTPEDREDKCIWRWSPDHKFSVPQQIRVFIWTALHQQLMSNLERYKRKLTSDMTCPFCGNEESIMYSIRDYPEIKHLWQQIIPPSWPEAFFSLDLWNRIIIGKHQCDLVFSHDCSNVESIFHIALAWARNFEFCFHTNNEVLSHVDKAIQWKKTPPGWFISGEIDQ
ncbi:hypothetical protein F3Y22_tig00000340pilonHSYRG00158 [Hibiscus syriacus]|uniref:Uncharacterized protein n=1 Tax=Hibiscus syriacus TaxID=106335 RepID=A0A6A3D122_HIBSY|nr:hypothetical protein F3Y22_tig00000340pilonHSYRG00158 [Hibiscus syriacus]